MPQDDQAIVLSVVIPVYNELTTVPALLERVVAAPLVKEVIVVDDGSVDGTSEFLHSYSNPQVKVLFHQQNLGKGAAIRTAQPHVRGEYVVIQDADLEYQPEEYPILLKPLRDGGADVVYGSRFLGIHRVYLVWHYLGNRFLTGLTNLLYNTNLTDMECGFKAFRREVFQDLRLRSKGFEIEPELTAKVFKRGLRVVEVPITYYGRDYREGKKITWLDAFPAIWALVKYRFVD